MKAGVFVDVQIVEHVTLQPESLCPIQRGERTPEKHKSTVDRVKRMLFDAGFNIKHIRELSIPSGSRVAHEVETGDLYRDRRRYANRQGMFDELLAWQTAQIRTGGYIKLYVSSHRLIDDG